MDDSLLCRFEAVTAVRLDGMVQRAERIKGEGVFGLNPSTLRRCECSHHSDYF